MTVANVNVTKVLLKRGNTVQNNNYTGVNGELTIDTQAATLRIHNGSTAGGTVINAAGGSYSNTNTAAYLTSQNITSANIGAFQIFANANAATQAVSLNSKANLSGAVFTGNIQANNIQASNKIETETFIRVGPAHDQGETWANPAALFFGNTAINSGPVGYGRYYQINLQNVDPLGSGDIVVTADDGNDASHYMSMGINNTAWNDPYYPMGLPNDGYLFVTGGNLQIVSDTHDIEFLVGNIANPQLKLTQANVFTLAPNVSVQFGDNSIQTTAYTGFTANSANWANPAPTTLNAAIDRLAALVKTLNGGVGA